MLVGFQGNDPSTDFRGSGQLGLENLLFFVSARNEYAQEVLKFSLDKETWYFFAVAGINITGKMLQQIEATF